MRISQNTHRKSPLICGAVALLWACSGEFDPASPQASEPGAANEICYQGKARFAEVAGDNLIVEGDMVIDPEDQWCAAGYQGNGAVGSVPQPITRRQGKARQWPGGVVPYHFYDSLSADEQETIRAAMSDWERAAPGLHFRPVAPSETTYVSFKKTGSCNSMVGHVAGRERPIELNSHCLGNFKVHHEIGHALGLIHTHARNDRNEHVRINWHNIQGCLDTAESEADCGADACEGNLASCGCTEQSAANKSCFKASDFYTNMARVDFGDYDYDSIMHYSALSRSKDRSTRPTIAVLETDAEGNPFPIGQSNHLSANDKAAMRAMYPLPRLHNVFFHDSGPSQMCWLEGREQDVSVQWDVTSDHPALSAPNPSLFEIQPGEYAVTCRAESVFWAEDYQYPNTTFSPDLSSYPSSSVEVYERSHTVRILSAGLLPVLLGT